MSDQEHESFIKTPKQLIVAVLIGFAVPIAIAVLASQFVTAGRTGAPDEERTAMAIEPVAQLKLGSAEPANAGPKTGKQVFEGVCSACHATGAAGAPKVGDHAAWGPRIAQGLDGLIKSATAGKGAMPPKGGAANLSELELARAIVFMTNQSGASFKEPAAPAAAKTADAGGAAAPDGKKVYEGTCVACHGTGVANSPKFGDKAAWGPRIAQGIDTLHAHALSGIRAMPSKGGNAGLSDAEVKAAVDYMVAAAK